MGPNGVAVTPGGRRSCFMSEDERHAAYLAHRESLPKGSWAHTYYADLKGERDGA